MYYGMESRDREHAKTYLFGVKPLPCAARNVCQRPSKTTLELESVSGIQRAPTCTVATFYTKLCCNCDGVDARAEPRGTDLKEHRRLPPLRYLGRVKSSLQGDQLGR